MLPHSARTSRIHPSLWLALAALSLLACQLVSPRPAATAGAVTPGPRRATPSTPRAQSTADHSNNAASTPAPRRPFTVGPAALSFLAPAQPANGVQHRPCSPAAVSVHRPSS